MKYGEQGREGRQGHLRDIYFRKMVVFAENCRCRYKATQTISRLKPKNTQRHKHTLLTLYSEVEPLCSHPSLIYSVTFVPARMIRGYGGHLQRKVGEDVHAWVQTGVLASSQPGEVEADGANDVASEDGPGARGGSYVTLDCDGWRGLCVSVRAG